MVLKDKTTVVFHSGILTIGGTVIEITYKNSTIYFDFGTEYRPELELKDDSLDTLIEHRLVPKLDGVYYKEINGQEHVTKKSNQHVAVFLSHAHLDHTRMVNYLHEDIPLYATYETKEILNILNANDDFLIPLPEKKESTIRNINALTFNETVRVGDISVTVMSVDHDAYGSVGMIIKTPSATIAYTGDLRLHGFRRNATLEFCHAAKHADALIIEGVSVSFEDEEGREESNLTEIELVNNIVDIVNDYPNKQVTFNTYPANLERLINIIQLSHPNRKVVVQAKMAQLIKRLFKMNVLFYYHPEDMKLSDLNPDYEISYQTLLEDEKDYVWQIEKDHQDLKDDGIYIHSNAQPLGPFDPEYDKFIQRLADKNIEFISANCSGHAYSKDLDKIISFIEPKLLIPIHSLHPERLENPFGERLLPSRGQTIYL